MCTLTSWGTLLTDDTNYKCQTDKFTPVSEHLQISKSLQQNTQITQIKWLEL